MSIPMAAKVARFLICIVIGTAQGIVSVMTTSIRYCRWMGDRLSDGT